MIAFRALMYLEFKGATYDIHIWDRKGAMTKLTGDAILRYVWSKAVLFFVEWSKSCRYSGVLYNRTYDMERFSLDNILFVLSQNMH